jgi:hypothetical protein
MIHQATSGGDRLGGAMPPKNEVRPGEEEAEHHEAEDDAQAKLGPTLGRELPTGVYLSVAAAYLWLLFAAWLSFGKSVDADLALAVATVISFMFMALPLLIFRIAWSHSSDGAADWLDFLSSTMDTATGPVAANEALLQILLIPSALALAAALIGITYRLVIRS